MAIKKKTALQLEALEIFYAKHKYPSQSAIKEIAASLELSCKQIRGWFIEKRRRDETIGTIVARPQVTNREKSVAASSPLGAEFDSPASRAFLCRKASRNSHLACQETQRATKRRKVSKHVLMDHEDSDKSSPVRKHGIGKSLMTAWRVTNPDGGYFPTGVTHVPIPAPRKPSRQSKKPRQWASILKQRKLENKLKNNKKRPVKTRGDHKKNLLQKPIQKERCELALEGVASPEHLNQFTTLVDDEELELRELQAGLNPLTCEHFASNGLRGCSLCRDVLPQFPPTSVKMKPPFVIQPWDSSPETVKKLFKVFHFLYTYSITVDICPFTLDEFAQAFHDKDSLLLAKIHVSLLKLLLSDIETELNSGLWPNLSRSCKFLALLHSVENQLYVLEFWRKSLNPLTWMEILSQVLLAAGFGSKKGSLKKEPLSKEMSLMKKYVLHPGTLKGELFKHLLEQGNNGLSVSELAKSSPIVELNLGHTTEELELLICSTLASDITLFEKISSSAFRLRISSVKEANDPQSDNEDSGSVHDDYIDCGSSSSSDSECDSGNFSPKKLEHQNSYKSKGNVLSVYTEIDESQPGEAWLLGLMEGEYSDLSIDEKLNALVGLLDILSAGSSIRVEDLPRYTVESIPNIRNYGSGGKIKISSSQKNRMPRASWVHGQMLDVKEAQTSLEFRPVDSSVSFSKSYSEEDSPGAGKKSKETKAAIGLHPMQSIFLGSDRRYNRYWLFLGPCDEYDPGHRRVYFESSEDGHWEVIDTKEALSALLSVLDCRGTREAGLIESMEKRGVSLCQAMSCRVANDAKIRLSSQSDHSGLEIVREYSSSPVSDVDNLCLTEVSKDPRPPCGAISLEVGKKGEDQSRKQSRLEEFDSWIWKHFYLELNAVKYSKRSYIDSLIKCETCHDLYWRDEKHCKNCHTTFELDIALEDRFARHAATCREQGCNDKLLKHKVLSSQLQSLKAAVHAIESVIPEDAMVGAWAKSAHWLWVKRLRRTSSLVELLQEVTDFVAAIKEDWPYKCHGAEGSDTVMQEIIACFPSMHQTSSAFALWLMKLDSLMAPYMEKVVL